MQSSPQPQDLQSLQEILNQMPDGAVELDKAGHIVAWNTHAIEILCGADLHSREVRWFTLLHIEDQRQGLEVWTNALATPGQWHTLQARSHSASRDADDSIYEWRFCRLSSTHTTVRCVVRNLDGPFKVLSEGKQRLRKTYEHTPIMAHAIDRRGRLLMVSDRWLEKLGYTRDEVIGSSSTDFLTPKSRAHAKIVLDDYFKKGYCHDIPYQMVAKSGRIVDVELSAIAEIDGEGNFERSFAVLVDVSRRNALFAELNHQNEMLESFFDALPAGAAMISLDRTITRVNTHMLNIFGYEEHELIGHTSEMLYADEQSSAQMEQQLKHVRTHKDYGPPVTLLFQRKQGELFLGEVSSSPVLDQDGNLAGFFNMLRDLSEVERLRLLAENERQLTQTFFEAVPSGAFIISLDATVSRANKAAHDMFGYALGELIGVQTSTFHADEHDAEHIKHTLREGLESLTFDCVRLDQSIFPARLSGAPYFDEHGTQVGFVALLQDITEGRTQRKALAQQSSLMEAFFEAIPYATVITDHTRRIIRANSSVHTIFDYTKQEVLGQATKLFYAEQKSFERMGSKVFNRGDSAPRLSTTVEFKRKNGQTFEGELIDAKIFNQHNEIEGYLGLMRDITHEIEQEHKLQEQNARLTQANKDLERFAYIASHDLQEPLRKISSFISMLEDHLGDQLDEAGALYFNYVRDGASRLQALIRDLLAYSRVDSLPELEPCKPLSILTQSISEYQTLLDEHDATIEIEDESHGALVMSHEAVLSQVYSNLLSNVIKYAHPERVLKVKVRCEIISQTHLGLLMEDNGIGIEKRYQEQVFEIFQRLHRQSEIAGQGIGLAICKKIIERQGGEFGVTSDGESGSTFWFTLRRAL